MRILVLSQWCSPEPNSLASAFARELAGRGHQVTLLTGFPNYPTGQIYPGYRLRVWHRERVDGVDILRVWLYPNHSRSGLRRVLNYFSFAVSAMVLGLFLTPKADVMWVYHPPLTVGAAATVLGMCKRIPFLYLVADLWPETVMASGMVSSPLVESAIRRMARLIYARAEMIAVVSPGFRENLIGQGVPPAKVQLVFNWGDDHFYYPCAALTLAESNGLDGKFNIIFAGNMGFAQNLQTVLDAAELLLDAGDVQFVLVGDGTDKGLLERQAAERKLTNVKFLGRKKEDEMAEIFGCASALLVQLRDDPLFAITIPSKIQAYLACGKPILCGVRGDAAQIVQEAGAGLIYDSRDPASLADAVRALCQAPAAERAAMGERGLGAYKKNFQLNSIISRYESLLRGMVERRLTT